jgi:GNAT superfamily N-acetyltransferase
MLASLPSVQTREACRLVPVAADIDVGPVRQALLASPGLWHRRTLRQDFPGSPHAETQAIWLRAPADLSDIAASFHDLNPVDYPEYDEIPGVRALVGAIAAAVGAQRVGRVLLVRLPAGALVEEHSDQGAYSDRFDRFHCCIQDGDAKLVIAGEDYHLADGALAWVNHKLPHAAAGGSSDRIHLIVDCVAPAWRCHRGGPFQREAIHGIWEEVMPLLRAHKDEIAHYSDIDLAPDFAAYERLEESGALRVYTARDENGRLVGYSAHFVRPNLHYSRSLQAQQDVLFLLKDYRRGGLGLRLIRYADAQLRAEGVQVSMQHVKARADLDFSPLLKRLGYEHVDQIYCRRLDS